MNKKGMDDKTKQFMRGNKPIDSGYDDYPSYLIWKRTLLELEDIGIVIK